MERCLAISPARPAGWRVQSFVKGRAQSVDRIAESQLGVDRLAGLPRCGPPAGQPAMVSSGEFKVRRMIVGELAGRKILRMMPPAGMWPHRVHAASAIMQKGTDDISGGVFERGK